MGKKKIPARPQEVRVSPPPAAGPKLSAGILVVLDRHSLAIAISLVLLATARIAATYTVFNHTYDEPAHIACGMEWLDKGSYTLETQHPPLSRIFSALGPFLAGERNQGRPTIYNEGAAILYHNGKYERTLMLARIGTLPFFWLACIAIYL